MPSSVSSFSVTKLRPGLQTITEPPTIFISRSIGLTADALNGNALGRQHFVLQRVHGCGCLVYPAHEGHRSPEDRFQPLAILTARGLILVLDDEGGIRHVESEKLARRQLMIEPVHGAILQVGERIVTRRAGQLVFGEHDLLLPRV